MTSSFVFKRGGVIIAPELCEPVWRALRAELISRRSDGGQTRPEVEKLISDLREAASDHLTHSSMTTNGHDKRTFEDIEPPLTMSTEALATNLGVGERQARRIAASEGIEPLARNAWARTDAVSLTARRKDHHGN